MLSLRKRLLVTLVLALAALFPASAALASQSQNGCNGLYDVARFATFQNVGDTHGHATVHHQFELRGCADDHHH